MKHRQPESRKKRILRWLGVSVSIVAFGTGAYLLLLIFAPTLQPLSPQSKWNEPVPKAATPTKDRLYIPRLSLNLQYKTGDDRVLNDGLWHRLPERGDPEHGGNFILSGHRFEIGLTPGETKRRSPLYHLDKVQTGDYLYADFSGKRYQYEVMRRYRVEPNQTEIEATSDDAVMTLYTCTLKGAADGREVVKAVLRERDVDPHKKLLVSAN